MKSPRFSIVIPAYNGGEYLKECVNSILAQTYNDWVLNVLDDASSDGSLEWLQQLNDEQLRIYPSPRRLGIVDNWSRILETPKGEFMTIIGQDDLLAPNYLEVMSNLVQRHPDAGLYHAHFRYINGAGRVLRSCRALPEQETAAGYISSLFSGNRDTHGAGYLFRSSDYERVGGIPRWPGLLFADDGLWISLMQGSYKATATEECFSIRKHQASAGASPDWHTWLAGMREYIPFLEQQGQQDAAVQEAFGQHAPGYFLEWCYNLYKLALMQATQRNERIEPGQVRAQISEVLQETMPALLPQFEALCTRSRRLRAREFINSWKGARWLYNLHLRLRLAGR